MWWKNLPFEEWIAKWNSIYLRCNDGLAKKKFRLCKFKENWNYKNKSLLTHSLLGWQRKRDWDFTLCLAHDCESLPFGSMNFGIFKFLSEIFSNQPNISSHKYSISLRTCSPNLRNVAPGGIILFHCSSETSSCPHMVCIGNTELAI